jgi:hypothetical protein
MTTDVWEEGTWVGAQAARARRDAHLTPQQRLDWLEAALREANRAGVLVEVRRRRQIQTLRDWRSAD